ncbi:OmpA family protein [Spirosoma sp. KUDC1026]|uniref:OmpA family protein n=1 Tax=Spirosoma sp. KUDC1026 TaxID=2745947 RepID=UPI00159B9274|nr:OmpA family protein [Spirosoma sp. KUDC1026]QKZ14649.1 OmpA family protein [Spirosoma sp. KUDC1026]
MNNTLKNTGTKSLAILMTASILTAGTMTGCKNSGGNMNKTQKGAAVGGGGGALVGGIIGRKTGNTALGAIIGATVGGAAGAVIGRRMDKQAEEMKRSMPNAEIERVGEGIKITFGSDILFDVNSAELKSATKRQLTEFAQTLNKYEDTDILIEGHADATGPDDLNQRLSERRADAVGNYLEQQGVKTTRVKEKGYGESQPIADNSTEAGRQKNRRVDIAVYANKQMQRDAKDGKLDN